MNIYDRGFVKFGKTKNHRKRMAHSNDHHHNYWIVDVYGSCNKEPLFPPVNAIKEMAADMIGASAAQGYPPNGAKDYYLKHRDRIILHPVARYLLEKELVIK